MKNILIIGGGITGLTSAFYLQQKIKDKKLPYNVKLVEATNRLGGKIATVHQDGFTIERGPDSFLSRKTPAVTLIDKLGLQDQLVRNASGQAHILVGKKLHKIPPGSFMGIPIEARPFLFSGLFGVKGKVRASLDYVVPKGKAQDDQSLGLFFRRRFGDELVENLIEPLLSGIYSGDMDEMSLMATFPNFYHLEQKYGSLIKGLQKTMPKRPKTKEKQPGIFYALRGGFESLVVELEKQIGKDVISLSTAVDHIEKKENVYHVLLSDGTVYRADAIIVATPHQTLRKIFSQHDMFKTADEIPNTSVANVALAYDQKAVKKELDGTGFVVSRNSNYRITACTWTHRKWPHTTPNGKVLLRSYVGGPNDPEAVHLTDEELVQVVLKDLNKTMKITGEPLFNIVTRFKNQMPQYTVGHKERIKTWRSYMAEQLPGVFLTGASYEGVGVPDCIEQGEKAVSDLVQFISDKSDEEAND
ncbi:protoporphyrinogen oxidase [Pseudogracilibacillus auburnensis]|uniref:protoporphyrinogen oxidase n=1 Tax=Pseudogracilibacillus auburnensis TaxID=1494959 RepID=UPI001A9624E1|nr:protoporphyrinogen oxidase [Pseudogracilibacillus auburnensis]MBO1002951.1 protoporphyrinogen oxidase [Pseudogracilibacillus auburnensis]